MSLTVKYQNKTDRLNKSYDFFEQAGQGDPWKLLAAAVIFQAAADCQTYDPEIERPCYNSSRFAGLQYRRRGKLVEFINSDWLDALLSWQHEITPEAVRDELIRRLTS